MNWIISANSKMYDHSSVKKFIGLIELMVLEFYEGIVQYVSTWTQPTPKLIQKENELINN